MSVVGTIKAISGNQVLVKSGLQWFALAVDKRTEVWKGTVFHNLAPVEVGDDIIARCRRETSGKLIADAMWLNIVDLDGVVTKVTADGFEMLTNPNADPESAYKKEKKNVSVSAATVFESSAKMDIKPGRGVQIVGLRLRNGNILATRVTVYEGNRPVRMGNGRVVLPNGQLR